MQKRVILNQKQLDIILHRLALQIEELEQQDSMTSLEQWHKWIEEAKSLMS